MPFALWISSADRPPVIALLLVGALVAMAGIALRSMIVDARSEGAVGYAAIGVFAYVLLVLLAAFVALVVAFLG